MLVAESTNSRKNSWLTTLTPKNKNMKYLLLPRITALSLALFLTAGVIVVSGTGCKPKPGCGNKRDHRKRKKRVKKFAPGMSYLTPVNGNIKFSYFI